MSVHREAASFRDPSGFVYRRDGVLLRQVNTRYREDYDHLMESGLYDALVEQGLLVAHEEADTALAAAPDAYRVLRPEVVPFVSHPYEWTFAMLQDAALLTLRVQRLALEHGMTLKDASAYNVQFRGAKPVFIDTLSFERLRDGEPWVAYGQFCRHFLAPLALMAHVDVRLGRLLATHVDGVPLDLAARMLPGRARVRPGLLLHVFLHARSQAKHADGTPGKPARGMTRRALEGILESLATSVRGLRWREGQTEWGDYYDTHAYSDRAFEHKREAVSRMLDAIEPRTVWDLGANAGVFSRLAAERGVPTASFDLDPVAVERNYRAARDAGDENLLPLVLDLTNPSPGLGWAHEERASLLERGPADAILALALVHHLAIGNNVPLPDVAAFFARCGRQAIVEWVPKDDPQVQRLLATREDVFDRYTEKDFEAAVTERFHVEARVPVEDSGRVLYHLRRREEAP